MCAQQCFLWSHTFGLGKQKFHALHWFYPTHLTYMHSRAFTASLCRYSIKYAMMSGGPNPLRNLNINYASEIPAQGRTSLKLVDLQLNV